MLENTFFKKLYLKKKKVIPKLRLKYNEESVNGSGQEEEKYSMQKE